MKWLLSLACSSLALAGCGEIIQGTETDEQPVVCGESFIACGTQCINPGQDPLFCGARTDCNGPNAGTVCAEGSACMQGECAAVELPPDPPTVDCANCGFENGNLEGWVTRDIINPTYPLAVAGAGVNQFGFFDSSPTQGSFALLNGFDGNGPGIISAAKTVTIPKEVSAILTFDYRAAWDMQGFDATEPRTFGLAIEAPNGSPLQTESFLVANPETLMPDTGELQQTVDLTSYMGQTIVLVFFWDIPEIRTGPSFFQLDNIQVLTE